MSHAGSPNGAFSTVAGWLPRMAMPLGFTPVKTAGSCGFATAGASTLPAALGSRVSSRILGAISRHEEDADISVDHIGIRLRQDRSEEGQSRVWQSLHSGRIRINHLAVVGRRRRLLIARVKQNKSGIAVKIAPIVNGGEG